MHPILTAMTAQNYQGVSLINSQLVRIPAWLPLSWTRCYKGFAIIISFFGIFWLSTKFLYPEEPLPLCPATSPKLVGPFKVVRDNLTEEVIWKSNKDLMPGGRYRPRDCTARYKVAVVIPYRAREEHLSKSYKVQ